MTQLTNGCKVWVWACSYDPTNLENFKTVTAKKPEWAVKVGSISLGFLIPATEAAPTPPILAEFV